jgi:hypothetical protein
VDVKGRFYLLWEAKDIQADGLIIQPFNSCYCFEVVPVTPDKWRPAVRW